MCLNGFRLYGMTPGKTTTPPRGAGSEIMALFCRYYACTCAGGYLGMDCDVGKSKFKIRKVILLQVPASCIALNGYNFMFIHGFM